VVAPDWLAYFTAAKSALDIIKGIRAELPKGPQADIAQRKIEEAESALDISRAQLAKRLGFKLCQCSFPPQIMLLKAAERKHVCPSCGNTFPLTQPSPDPYENPYLRARL
jgi:hypothetical protein